MASPGRAYWKGFLRLSLVSIAVEIYNAVDTSTEIPFNQIHQPSGKRINYTKTVKGIGPVETSDIVKGYEVDKDQYVFFEPDELDAIKLESKKTLDLVQFVDVNDIDPRYFERLITSFPRMTSQPKVIWLFVRRLRRRSGWAWARSRYLDENIWSPSELLIVVLSWRSCDTQAN